MQHYWSLDDVSLNDVWLTIGSFDGVHLGHQSIISRLTAGAHNFGVPAVVLTFHPHPAVILRDRQGPYYLTSPEERATLLAGLGVDAVITHPFNPQVALSFELSLAGPVQLTIFNLRGRRTATLHAGHLDQGHHHLFWDGRDQDGRSVPAGIYVAQLTGHGQTITRKVVLAK